MDYKDGKSIYANSTWFEYRIKDSSDLSRILDYMKKQGPVSPTPGDSNSVQVEDSMELDLPVQNSELLNKQ